MGAGQGCLTAHVTHVSMSRTPGNGMWPIAMSLPTASMWTDNLQEQKRVLRKWDKFLAGAALPVHQPRDRTFEVSRLYALLA